MIGAIALATSRLRFVTTVYLPAMRDPYSAAKAIGTAACLADGRLEQEVLGGHAEADVASSAGHVHRFADHETKFLRR